MLQKPRCLEAPNPALQGFGLGQTSAYDRCGNTSLPWVSPSWLHSFGVRQFKFCGLRLRLPFLNSRCILDTAGFTVTPYAALNVTPRMLRKMSQTSNPRASVGPSRAAQHLCKCWGLHSRGTTRLDYTFNTSRMLTIASFLLSWSAFKPTAAGLLGTFLRKPNRACFMTSKELTIAGPLSTLEPS